MGKEVAFKTDIPEGLITKDETIELLNTINMPIYNWNKTSYQSYIGWNEYGIIQFNNDEDIESLITIIKQAQERNQDQFIVFNTGNNPNLPDFCLFSITALKDSTSDFGSVRISKIETSSTFGTHHTYGNNNQGKTIGLWYLGVSLENGVVTGYNPIHNSSSLNENVYLSAQNTNEYVPTEPYHPSTKDYVDTNIKTLDDKIGVINTQLEEIINGGA
jgi:hypothetical protein